MEKKKIRESILKMRKNLSASFIVEAENQIFSKLKSTNILDFKTFLIYSSFNNEVGTKSLIYYLAENGREVYLPKCDIGTKTFEAVRLNNNQMQMNKYGILEPADMKNTLKTFDCAIVPGIAFDTQGNRIGFGAGYYDKFFKDAQCELKIGLCYDFQLFDCIPHNQYDVKMDLIITESKVIYTK